MDWEEQSCNSLRAYSYSKSTTTDHGDSRDSGFSGSRDADETFHGTTPTTPTDFSSLAESFENQPVERINDDNWPSIIEETLVLSTKNGFSASTPFWVLNTESNNFHYLDQSPISSNSERSNLKRRKADVGKHLTPVYSRQISAPVRSKERPLAFKDITNTPKLIGASKTSPQNPTIKSKLNRKRTLALEKEAKKRRTSNELVTELFEHENDRSIPPSARSLPRVHSSSLLESSGSREYPVNQGSPDPLEHYSLRTVERPQIAHNAFRSISGGTLCELLGSMTGEQFQKKFFLVDCRYPYEYNGGHIRHAVNIFDPSRVSDVFYPSEKEKFDEINSKIPIFYCEFSQKRGPCMAQELRRLDRARNESDYPFIHYKEIYVLDQGYKQFYDDQHIEFCEPKNYIPMFHPSHQADLKLYRFHKKSVYVTEQRAAQRYANGRKVSSATLRKQLNLRAGTIRSHSLSDWDDSFTPTSSGIRDPMQDSTQATGHFYLSESPVSSMTVTTVGSSAKQLPQRFSRLTMQSPSSPASSQPAPQLICESLIFQSRRSLFTSICEESSCSSNSSASSSPQPTDPLPKPLF